MTLVHRFHPALGAEALCARSLAQQLRPMMLPPKANSYETYLRKQVEKLQRSRPERLSGRHLFMRDSLKVVHEHPVGSTPRSSALARKIFSEHASKYAELPAAVRQEYSNRAASLIRQKRDLAADELSHAQAALSLIHQRRQQQCVDDALPMLLSNVRFSMADFVSMHKTRLDVTKISELVRLHITEVLVSPGSPSSLHLDDLKALDPWAELFSTMDGEPPRWAAKVCRFRDVFSRCVLAFEGEKTQYFLILCALRKPYHVLLSPLSLVCSPFRLPSADDMDLLLQELEDHSGLRFSVDMGSFVCDKDSCFDGLPEPKVIPQAMFVDEGLIVCRAAKIDLSDYVAGLDKAEKGKGEKRARLGTDPDRARAARLIQQYPWLSDLHATPAEPSSRRGSVSSGGDAIRALHVEPLDELEETEVWARLAAKRAERAVEHFSVAVLGGAWTQRHLNVPFDALQGRARSEVARQFCKDHGLQNSARYNFKKYGERVAGALANEWVRRMGHLLDSFLRHDGSEQWILSDAPPYSPPELFTDIVKDANAASRVRQLDELVQLATQSDQ